MTVILKSSRTACLQRIIIFFNQSRTKRNLVKTAILIILVLYIAYLLYYILLFGVFYYEKYRLGLISSTFLRLGDFLNLFGVGDLKESFALGNFSRIFCLFHTHHAKQKIFFI